MDEISVKKNQSLRFKRFFISNVIIVFITLVCTYLYIGNHLVISYASLMIAMGILWAGQIVFFVLIYTGYNLKFSDPSLTLQQMTWVTLFLLYFAYAIKDVRNITLIGYFGILSFGYFRLNAKVFGIHAIVTLLSYLFIILYIYINEPLRIQLEKEILQLFIFSGTIAIVVYIGADIHRLREAYNKHTKELEEAVKLNMLLAVTDDLTGLYTRSYLMDVIEQQKARADRENNNFIVLFADLDHFKSINDTYGHHTGDAVLEDFAEIMKNSIREVDYAARFGGEEFVLVLVNTDMTQAKIVAERIRTTLEKHNFSDIAPNLRVTVSIGAASYQEFNSIQETLQTADKRMYQAKELGRNTCVYS